MRKRTRELTASELATTLAALRYWQQEMAGDLTDGIINTGEFFQTCQPLTEDEIDEFCETLNFGNPRIEI